MTATTHERPPTTRRTRRHVLALGLVGVAVLLAGGVYAWLVATSELRDAGLPCAEVPVTGAPPGTERALRDGVCATMDALVTTWDGGDAVGYGARFTEDATYAAFTGTIYRGRADIVAGHTALFSGLLEGTRLYARYLSVDVIAPGVVRVLTRGDTYEGDEPTATPSKVQTHLLVERDGTWQVAAFHNTQRKSIMERVQFLVEPGSRPLRER